MKHRAWYYTVTETANTRSHPLSQQWILSTPSHEHVSPTLGPHS